MQTIRRTALHPEAAVRPAEWNGKTYQHSVMVAGREIASICQHWLWCTPTQHIDLGSCLLAHRERISRLVLPLCMRTIHADSMHTEVQLGNCRDVRRCLTSESGNIWWNDYIKACPILFRFGACNARAVVSYSVCSGALTPYHICIDATLHLYAVHFLCMSGVCIIIDQSKRTTRARTHLHTRIANQRTTCFIFLKDSLYNWKMHRCSIYFSPITYPETWKHSNIIPISL